MRRYDSGGYDKTRESSPLVRFLVMQCALVSKNPVTRAFIEELAQVHKSSCTIDNYSRDLDDFLQANADLPFSTLLEADEGQIARYVDGLWSRPARRGSGHKSAKEKITYITDQTWRSTPSGDE
jgi:hypothetical protein